MLGRGVTCLFLSTVKNGKFEKILTLQRRTLELFIWNSKICVRSFTTFDFRVTNWDFWGLYGCCFAKEEWRLQKTQYFVGSSLFVAQHYAGAVEYRCIISYHFCLNMLIFSLSRNQKGGTKNKYTCTKALSKSKYFSNLSFIQQVSVVQWLESEQ